MNLVNFFPSVFPLVGALTGETGGGGVRQNIALWFVFLREVRLESSLDMDGWMDGLTD